MGDAGIVKRRVGRALTALIVTLGLVFTGGVAAHAALAEPNPNAGSTAGGTETSMVVGQQLTQVSAGHHHSVALGSDGNVYSWGDNTDGQLGDGTKLSRSRPVLV